MPKCFAKSSSFSSFKRISFKKCLRRIESAKSSMLKPCLLSITAISLRTSIWVSVPFSLIVVISLTVPVPISFSLAICCRGTPSSHCLITFLPMGSGIFRSHLRLLYPMPYEDISLCSEGLFESIIEDGLRYGIQ